MNKTDRYHYQKMKIEDIRQLRAEFTKIQIEQTALYLFGEVVPLEQLNLFAVCLIIGTARARLRRKKIA